MTAGEVACRNAECATVAWPQMALNSKGKIAPACPKCGLEHADVMLEDFQVGKPVDGERKALPDVAVARPIETHLPRLSAHTAAAQMDAIAAAAPPRPVYVPSAAAVQAFDPISACRDRLTFLHGEDARLEGVVADARARLAGIRVEAKKLSKMLSAAARVTVDTSHHQ